MDEAPPPRQLIRRLSAVVVQHDALAEAARGQHRRQRGKQERPVGGGEDVDDIGVTEPGQAREIEGLVEHGSGVRVASEPPQAGRKARVDWNVRDVVTVAPEPGGDRSRLDELTPY